jgi:hypothetical protein
MKRAALLLAIACIGGCWSDAFTCSDSTDCNAGPEGVCEENQHCTYADESCEGSGRVWGPHAGVGVAGQCVGPDGVGSNDPATEGGSSAPSSAATSVSTESGAPIVDCAGIDFLFVIDNGDDMEGPQAQLYASFLGFWTGLDESIVATDHHIMVVDADAFTLDGGSTSCPGDGNPCTCSPEPDCCPALCHNGSISPAPTECGGHPCTNYMLPMGCANTLGAGRTENSVGTSCGFPDGQRYISSTQEPNVPEAFECASSVGTDGSGHVGGALLEAISGQSEATACNEGFLRDDAILVVTVISNQNEGVDVTTTSQVLVNAKHGDESAVVMLVIAGDTEQAGSPCDPEGEIDDAPALRQLAGAFDYGDFESICETSYVDFFTTAVALIDQACETFDSPLD